VTARDAVMCLTACVCVCVCMCACVCVWLTGMWYAILQFINVVGVVTNACLIAFTSSWGNSHDITGQLLIVIVFEVRALTSDL